jgi:Protein of unknown function (DUF3732)
MNLLTVVLYSKTGEQRVVDFRPGELNIVTGWSRTGKSALLDIVEFCLGRDTLTLPVGPITDTVSWYAVVIQLPTTRAFVARPAPKAGRNSTQQAMLEIAAEIEPLPFADLRVNADSDTVREQLGRHIGIGENLSVPAAGSLRSPLAAHLGHALWLCLQGQGEIANRNLLFHRQGEPGIADALRATLPYFLGAVPADQALKRQQLLEARRTLRRLQADLAAAEQINADVAVDLRALLVEAHTRGLAATADIEDPQEILATLTAALDAQPPQEDERPAIDSDAERRRSMERERDRLRRSLRDIAEQRALLTEQARDERGYEAAVRTGTSRLASLGLLSLESDGHSSQCPVCGSVLAEPDPTVEQLRATLDGLHSQLQSVQTSVPRRATALTRLDLHADELRQTLRSLDTALSALRTADGAVDPARRIAEQQAFTKGRIDLYLDKLRRIGDDTALQRLREQVRRAQRLVDQLAADLDPDEEREQITSRLLIIARDMTRWADRLQLEHRGANVRIELNKLTVVTDTASGPAPLPRIGSAENWISYHLITHLALHRYFVQTQRPVPHMLILDQPTQAFYPSEVDRGDGTLPEGDDRAAVHRMFELMHEMVAELAPTMQIIVCDHANLPDPWFQDAVRHNWRDGEALIPALWINS